jgi:hypothetical protein
MDRISAPPQNALLGRLADLLRLAETGAAGGPEFLPKGLDVMNLVRQLALPSAETVEKLSYGDPLFRMAPSGTGSRIPMTTDREYLADVAGMVPIAAPAARPSARGVQELVRQIQTEPPVGAVKLPPAPGLLEKSDIGFYSQLESAVQPLQNKGTGQQYLAQIQKSAGVKPEEIQWTGLDDFLKSKPSVTKQEVQDYLAANRVNVQEVRLGRTPAMVQAERDAAFGAYDRGEITLEQRNAILERSEPATTRHHLGAYKSIATEIPGGENYREILLTLPQKGMNDLIAAEQKRDILARQTADLMGEWKNLSEEMPGDPRVVELYQRLSETRKQRDNAVVDARELRAASEAQTYRSSHFNQPNILAHMRVNDRVVDGKKTLFVEEIQSDWHQAGRKKGYKTRESLENWYNQNKLETDPPFSSLNSEQISVIERNRSAGMGDDVGVPDAPFKTTWHELSLKRAIQEASEKGYDQIAFTTGKTQAARYDLSKQVNSLKVERNTDGNFSLRIKRTDQDRTFEPLKSNITQQELSDYIGKDLAEKVAKDAEGATDFNKVYSGLDLQVGGEGMKGFYDNILPKSLEKLGKKFNAKVGKTEMDGVEVWQMDITPQMRESVVTKGQPLFAIPAIGTGLLGAGMMQEEETY